MRWPGRSGEEDNGVRFAARLHAARARASALFATRAEILREEISEKSVLAAKGFAGLALAAFFLGIVLLLATALVAALFAKLFGSWILGVTATLVLALGVVAAAGWAGWKALAKVQPFDFPATGSELSKDIDALAAAFAPAPEPDDGERTSGDLEARFRAGSE